MKHVQNAIPGTLLVTYAVYTAFTPITIAHSIILASLASVFVYQQFIQFQRTPKLLESLQLLKNEMDRMMLEQKEFYDLRIKAVEFELSKQAIAKANSGSTVSNITPKPKAGAPQW